MDILKALGLEKHRTPKPHKHPGKPKGSGSYTPYDQPFHPDKIHMTSEHRDLMRTFYQGGNDKEKRKAASQFKRMTGEDLFSYPSAPTHIFHKSLEKHKTAKPHPHGRSKTKYGGGGPKLGTSGKTGLSWADGPPPSGGWKAANLGRMNKEDVQKMAQAIVKQLREEDC